MTRSAQVQNWSLWSSQIVSYRSSVLSSTRKVLPLDARIWSFAVLSQLSPQMVTSSQFAHYLAETKLLYIILLHKITLVIGYTVYRSLVGNGIQINQTRVGLNRRAGVLYASRFLMKDISSKLTKTKIVFIIRSTMVTHPATDRHRRECNYIYYSNIDN